MNLESLTRKRDYYEEVAPVWVHKIWSRPQAFDHFIKYNKVRLTNDGALVKIGRDYFVATEKFPSVAIEILGLDSIRNGDEHEA